MNIHKEHLNIGRGGELKGLYRIDASKVQGVDLWDKLDNIVKAYTKLHPIEIKMCVIQNGELERTRLNDYASSVMKGTANLRWGCNVPVALMFKLEQVEPELFSNRKLYHKFLNKFKGFRVCKKV